VGGRGFEQVELVTEDGLATVQLNRPDRYNALGARIVEEPGEALVPGVLAFLCDARASPTLWGPGSA
jgi:hypothetical protein